jgi:hypothetical protein
MTRQIHTDTTADVPRCSGCGECAECLAREELARWKAER